MNVDKNLVLVLGRNVVGRENVHANAVDGRCLGFDMLARKQRGNGFDRVRSLVVSKCARSFACLPGRMSAGRSGSAFAGTSIGAGSVVIATVGIDSKAPQAIVLKSFMSTSSLFVVPHWNQHLSS